MQRRWIPEPSSIRPGYNATGSDLAANRVVILSGTLEEQQVKLPGAATDNVFGATMNAIANGARGDVLCRGQAVLACGGTVTANAKVTMDTAGKIVDWTASGASAVVGIARQDGALDELVEVELAGPGTFDVS